MKIKIIFITLLSTVLFSCAVSNNSLNSNLSAKSSDDLFIVDCLLPAQVRQLGQIATYMTARRAIKTSAAECAVRGGEFVRYDRANLSTALKIWSPKAQNGDPEAQYYVGEIYEKGLGVEPDYEMAVVWYKKSARQNYSKAQMSLGYLYEKGLGVERNMAKAMEWYEKASGLAALNIPYASTITSPQKSGEISTELKLLKSALNNSQVEAKNLKNKLSLTKESLIESKAKLLALQSDLSQVQKKVEVVNDSTQDQNKIDELNRILKNKSLEIDRQQSNIQKLQEEYESKISALTTAFSEKQKRAEQILVELKKKENNASTSQVALLEAELKLAETEKRLLKINDESNLRLLELNTFKKKTQEYRDLSQSNEEKVTQNKVLNDKYLSDIENKEKELQALRNTLSKEREQYAQDLLKQSHDKQEKQRLSMQAKMTEQLKAQYNRDINNKENELRSLKDALLAEKQRAEQQLLAQQQQLKSLSSKIDQEGDIKGQYLKEIASRESELKKIQSAFLAEKKRNEQEFMLRNQQQTLAYQQEKQKLSSQLNSEKALKESYLLEIENKDNKLAQLNKALSEEKQRYEREIKKLQQSVKREQLSEKPVIEIIDPPFVLTRGVSTVTLRSVVKQREIIGKVVTPTGLLSLSINDEKKQINNKGLFKYDLKLQDEETPVKVVAIDNNGNKTSLDFVMSMRKAMQRSITAKDLAVVQPEKNWETLDFGNYHALIIANNDYKKVPKLDTPITDGKEIEKILRTKYGFKTELLINGTRYQILSALNKLRANLTEDDNLLVYYAGHGELDKVNMRGHWLPVDADGDNTANWISTVALTDILNSMSTKHIMVVSDSCYSGAMTRSGIARIDAGLSSRKRNDWLKAMIKKRSRTVLTSGGLKPVMDGGGGKHSVFASAFIKALESNDQLLEGQALYRNVSSNIVSVAAQYGIDQVPEYAPIRHAGHESGEFFFVPTL